MDRFKLKDLSHIKLIFELYRNKLIKHGYNDSKNWPCLFNYFNNEVKIADVMRKIYWEMGERDKALFGNPFNTFRKKSYFNWLNKNVDIKIFPISLTLSFITIYKFIFILVFTFRLL